MKTFIVLCCLVAIAIATPTALELHSKWNEFKLAHGKTYKDANEEKKRIEIFAENVNKIEEHNKLYEQGLTTYKMAVNKFADWSHEEFVQYLTKHNRTQHKSLYTFQKPLNVELPTSIDWREKGAVTAVKDQGSCGGCWAFSTTGSLEGQSAITKGTLVSLSEQELIDCSTDNEGCNGGLMDYAFVYVEENGLTTEAEYPFTGYDGTCSRSGKSEAVRASGYVDIESGSESSLLSAVATVGPISIAVDAANWSFYSEGIYTGSCGSSLYSLDHGVLVVGYTENYWIVKNSWGSSWGEEGYIRLPRNENACGIATEASYPLLE